MHILHTHTYICLNKHTLHFLGTKTKTVKLLAGCVSEGHVISVWKKRFAIGEQSIKRLLGIGSVFIWKNASSKISFNKLAIQTNRNWRYYLIYTMHLHNCITPYIALIYSGVSLPSSTRAAVGNWSRGSTDQGNNAWINISIPWCWPRFFLSMWVWVKIRHPNNWMVNTKLD